MSVTASLLAGQPQPVTDDAGDVELPDADDLKLTLTEAALRGWGHQQTLRQRIKSGRLPAERVNGRGTFVVRESDLLRDPDLVALRRSRGWGSASSAAGSSASDLDALATLAARMVATWPRLSEERKRELGALLATP